MHQLACARAARALASRFASSITADSFNVNNCLSRITSRPSMIVVRNRPVALNKPTPKQRQAMGSNATD